ncbi:MAG: hypothetical protein QOF21_1566 [Actinomycetota bacterium]
MSIHTSTESLNRLALTIDADLGEVGELPNGESASLIRVTRSGEIAIRSLDGDHPFDALLGFVAPDDWEVLGVIAPGWGTQYAKDPPVRRRLRVIHVASRSGEEASVLRWNGETAAMATPTSDKPIGRVADCLRRALDLPTAEEPDHTLNTLWVHRILQALASRRHPSFGPRLVEAREIDDIVVAAGPTSWGDERWSVVQSEGSILMDGSVAAWMDDGMYARYVMADLPDRDAVLDTAKAACTAAAWQLALIAMTAILIDDSDDEEEPF